MDYSAEYARKLRTADEAVRCVKSGDWVEYTSNLGFPVTLDRALSLRRDELHSVKIRGDLIFGPIAVAECDPTLEHFVYNTWHCSAYERRLIDCGRAFFEPMIFRNLAWYYKNFLHSDVCMVTVSGMDEEGYFYFGSSLGLSKCIADNSAVVIVEVNRNTPRILGSEDVRIHISQVDMIVESGDPPLYEMPNPAPTETDIRIARHVLPHIRNGATVQLGIGGMPNALGELIAVRLARQQPRLLRLPPVIRKRPERHRRKRKHGLHKRLHFRRPFRTDFLRKRRNTADKRHGRSARLCDRCKHEPQR